MSLLYEPGKYVEPRVRKSLRADVPPDATQFLDLRLNLALKQDREISTAWNNERTRALAAVSNLLLPSTARRYAASAGDGGQTRRSEPATTDMLWVAMKRAAIEGPSKPKKSSSSVAAPSTCMGMYVACMVHLYIAHTLLVYGMYAAPLM